jgi:hypothetical protein
MRLGTYSAILFRPTVFVSRHAFILFWILWPQLQIRIQLLEDRGL